MAASVRLDDLLIVGNLPPVKVIPRSAPPENRSLTLLAIELPAIVWRAVSPVCRVVLPTLGATEFRGTR
jgi:hypothetical protein